jgi:hypothetical protein
MYPLRVWAFLGLLAAPFHTAYAVVTLPPTVPSPDSLLDLHVEAGSGAFGDGRRDVFDFPDGTHTLAELSQVITKDAKLAGDVNLCPICPQPQPIVAYSGAATAHADLPHGKFGVIASGSVNVVPPPFVIVGDSTTTSRALISYHDVLRFDTADDATATTITLTIALDGHVARSDGGSEADFVFISTFSELSASGVVFPPLRALEYANQDKGVGPQESVVARSWIRNGNSFSTVLTLNGPDPYVAVFGSIGAFARGGLADYSSTAAFGIQTPPGVTFDSLSGAFLAPVPEPLTSVMMLSGLAVLALALRRKHSRALPIAG